jgi:four helix bundle protein
VNKGPIYSKSFAFAVRVVKMARWLQAEQREFVLSKQILRSGTAVGALVREAEHGESRADFCHKMNIALKEANETLYWLDLLYESKLLTADMYNSMQPDAEELVKLLVAIVKTSRANA